MQMHDRAAAAAAAARVVLRCVTCDMWCVVCVGVSCATQILEEQHALFFHLQQQRLIELIRGGKTEEALAFAQEYLAPHGEENEAFLEELGETHTRLGGPGAAPDSTCGIASYRCSDGHSEVVW